jgi:hypothetical protein
MAESFDMSGALKFDLARGRVSLNQENERNSAQIVLPAAALSGLWRSLSVAQLKDFGHTTGAVLGARAATRLGPGLHSLEPRDVVEHLGGELALSGLGSLTLESWGQALVFAVVGCPLSDDPDTDGVWLAALLEGALVRLFSRELEVVPLKATGSTVRLVLCNRSAGAQVRGWLASGSSFGDIIERLNNFGVQS